MNGTRGWRRFGVVALAAAVTACGGRDAGPSRSDAEKATARNACIAQEVLNKARGDVESLDQMLPGGEAGLPSAAHAFARAFRDYAELRFRVYAYQDSAQTADTPADSARYAGRAAVIAPRPAAPETVESNVAREYSRGFQTIRSSREHFCNDEVFTASDEQ